MYSNTDKIYTSLGSHHIENDILYIIYKEDADVDIPDIDESKEVRLKLQQGKPMKVLLDARKLYQISKEAREYVALEENAKLSSVMAIVISSMAMRIVMNFYLKYQKPSTPTKIFDSEEKAVKWLTNYKDVNK